MLYEEHAGAGLLDLDKIQGSFNHMQGVTVDEADSKLQPENMHSKTEIKKMQQQSVLVAEADLAKLHQENMQMKAEIKKMQQQLDLLAMSARGGAHDLM